MAKSINMFSKFGINFKKMKDCHELYLTCDVLVSADVFEKFRNAQLGCILGLS